MYFFHWSITAAERFRTYRTVSDSTLKFDGVGSDQLINSVTIIIFVLKKVRSMRMQ